MHTVVIVIHLMIVMAMVAFVLLQKSEGGGLGTGSSNSGGFLSTRGTANVLTRTTALLAAAFFVTSLALSIIAGLDRKPKSILQSPAPAQQVPGAPAAPAGGGGGGLLDQLGGGGQGQQPSGPQVPQSR
jgi:preprotein translocase subunit SecG